MLRENSHPSDQELLLVADGELSARHTAQVRSHLTACWSCRARMAEIEEVIADFARVHQRTFDPMLPPIDGARERLRHRLADVAAIPHTSSRRSFRIGLPTRVAAYVGMAIFITAVVGNSLIHYFAFRSQPPALVAFEPEALPNPNLTPGATRQAAVSEVCVTAPEQVVTSVPPALRQEVLREYGIATAKPDDYEIADRAGPGWPGRHPQSLAATQNVSPMEFTGQGRIGRTPPQIGLFRKT
jgi:anti-sigma factor RsiW